MDGYRLQILLFDLIRERVDNPKNWIDEIAEKLNLSKSAVYKKVNATSSLSLEELSDLLVAYDINFDQLIRPETVSLRFMAPGWKGSPDAVEEMLAAMTSHITRCRAQSEARLDMVAAELPLFYWFMDRQLCHFKLYSMSMALGEEVPSAFSLETVDDEADVFREAQELLAAFMQIPGAEIWHQAVMTHAIGQINFSLNQGHFTHIKDALTICQALKSVLGHIETMVQAEKKFLPDSLSEPELPDLQVFVGASGLCDNSLILSSDQEGTIFSSFAGSAYLSCRDDRYVEFIGSNFERHREATGSFTSNAERRKAFFDRMNVELDEAIIRIEEQVKL